jgi:signal transduction histidine kinase
MFHRFPIRILFALLLLLCCNGPLTFAGPDTYRKVHFTNETGLPQSSVKSIAADEFGFIWLATEAGLVRFDGKQFRLFNKKNTGVSNSRILSIERDKSGSNLYAVSQSLELLKIEKGLAGSVLEKFEEVSGLPEQFAGTETGLVHLSWRYGDWDILQPSKMVYLNVSPGISVLLRKDGVIRWFEQGELRNIFREVPLSQFPGIFPLGKSLYHLSDSKIQPYVIQYTASGRQRRPLIGDIHAEPAHCPWQLCYNSAARQAFIYTNGSMYLLSALPDGSLHTKLIISGLDFARDQIISGYYDPETGIVYLGSANNGLFMYKPSSFKARTNGRPDENKSVFYGQVTISDSSILTGRGIEFRTGSDRTITYPHLEDASNGFGSAIIRTTAGDIWTANISHVFRHQKALDRPIQSWEVPAAFSLFEGFDGTMWMGTRRSGLFRLADYRKEVKAESYLPSNEYIICINQEDPEHLWLGTERNLLRVYLPEKRVDTIKELAGKVVRSLYIPRKGEVWICTYEDGMYLFKDSKLTHLPQDSRGYLNTAHCILEDRNGFFWVSTNNGLFQVLKQDLLQYAEGKTRSVFFLHYTKESGFHTNEFNGGSLQVGSRLVNGYFALSSMNGIVFFKPLEVKPLLPDKPLIVDRVELDGVQIPVADTLVLHQSFSRLNIRLATFYPGNPENLVMEYRTEHQDQTDEWAPFENEMLSFTALPMGRNIVTIRRTAGFGPDNYVYKTMVIDIPPSWWETMWFRVLATLFAFAVLWIMLAARLRYLRNKTLTLERIVDNRTIELKRIIGMLEESESVLEKELAFQKRLNENMAHDINTPLKYLTITARYLLEKVRRNEVVTEEEMRSVLEGSERIHSYAGKLVNFMKSHIDMGQSATRSEKLRELIYDVMDMFQNAADARNNKFQNLIEPALEVPVHRQLMEIMIHNLVDNAVKITQSGIITFTAEKEDQYTVVHISDTGPGMDEETVTMLEQYFNSSSNREAPVRTGLGFKTIRDMLPLMNGRVQLHSKPGKGTRFSIYIYTGSR